MAQSLSLFSGTVSDLDSHAGLGLIDADSGEIVFFNYRNLNSQYVAALNVGTRVEFASHQERFGPHADFVQLSE